MYLTDYFTCDNACGFAQGMLQAFKAAPEGTIVLLHACAHNPTGMLHDLFLPQVMRYGKECIAATSCMRQLEHHACRTAA